MIEWCNAHNGFIMAVLTAGSVVGTFVLAALSVWTCRLSKRNLDQVVKLDQERSRPVIIMDVYPDMDVYRDSPLYFLRTRNIGLTIGYDIHFAISPEPKCFYGQHRSGGTPFGYIKRGIKSLAPQEIVHSLLGTIFDIRDGLQQDSITGRITYTDRLGNRYETKVDVDLTVYDDMVWPDNKTIDSIGRELEKIRGSLDSLGSGSHKLNVITQDINEKRNQLSQIA